MFAARKGIRDAGVADNDADLLRPDGRPLPVPHRQRRHHLFLQQPQPQQRAARRRDAARTLGLFDDLWFRWVIDFGTPGPDRGRAASICCCRRATAGRCPTAAISSAGRPRRPSRCSGARSSRTTTRPAVAAIKSSLKIYPYVPGSYGTSIGTFLTGKGPLAPSASRPRRSSSRAPASS